MTENFKRGHVLIEATKSGCLLSFGVTCLTAVIAAILGSLFVPGAWRGRPLFSEPASISFYASPIIGFIAGFVIKFRELKKTRRGKS